MEQTKENLRVLKTKKRLKESVVELLKQGDASLINVRSICEFAKINRTTFYNHYQDKESLLKEMILDTVDASCDFLKAFLEKRNRGLAMTRMLQYYRDNDGFFKTLMKTDYADSFIKLMIHTLWEKNCLWSKDANVSLSSYEYYRIVFKVTGVIYIILQWLEDDKQISLSTMSSYILSFLSGKTTKMYPSVDLIKKR
ncbi:TetR/AcrR family transcriptional regulator [Fibrobacter sp.]|uniref:TetR/AcrR family transcriptional regulator n=1 Tax=Fibrobacter sp. TaxID=35828 RepID=UPI00388EC3A5